MDPLAAYNDESLKPQFQFNEGQREALANMVGNFKGIVGLVDLGEGYAKVLFYDAEGHVVEHSMLFPLYGDAVMPEFRHWP
jgi:hypothetical protein